MRDKYLIIYKNSVCVIRQETVSEDDLATAINEIIMLKQGEILTVSKCFISA